jgi:hypothetical protein
MGEDGASVCPVDDRLQARARDRNFCSRLGSVDGVRAPRVSLQVAILKVLASYPDGKATLAAMKSDLAILAGAGVHGTSVSDDLGPGFPIWISLVGVGVAGRNRVGIDGGRAGITSFNRGTTG